MFSELLGSPDDQGHAQDQSCEFDHPTGCRIPTKCSGGGGDEALVGGIREQRSRISSHDSASPKRKTAEAAGLPCLPQSVWQGTLVNHPLRSDRFRHFIAERDVGRLLLWYVVLTLVVAAVLALAWAFADDGSGRAESDYFLSSLLALYGMQDLLFDGARPPTWLLAVIAPLAVLLPTLLLGAAVYKVLAPGRDLLVFRKRLELVERDGGCHLVVYFYISSKVPLRFLELTAVGRSYDSSAIGGTQGEYPMKTFVVRTRWNEFHLPFPQVASTVFVPVNVVSGDAPPCGTNEIALTRSEDGAVRVHSANGRMVNPERGDFLELFLLATARLPSLQSDHTEVHGYQLPADLAAGPLHAMRTPFDPENYRFDTPASDWVEFDG